jgi:hypothetical protein
LSVTKCPFIVGAYDSQVHKGTPFDPIFLGEALQSTPRSYTFHFSTPIDVAVREAADMRFIPFSDKRYRAACV